MSILTQKKVTIIGTHQDHSKVLKGIQSIGCMHVIPIVPLPKEAEKIVNPKANDAYKALKFLTEIETTRRQITHKQDFDVNLLVEESLELKLNIRRARDKRDFLAQRLKEIEPWGNITYSPDSHLDGYLFWYYMVPLKQKNLLSNLEMPWHVVFSDNKYAYTVLISKKEPDSSVLPLTRTHLGTKSKVELLDELEQTELALDDLNAKRQGLTRFIYLLSVNIAQADDKASLASASQKTFDDGQVIALQGWVPDIRLDEVTDFARSENLVCIAENPEEGEVPPTQLKQPKKMSAAKDLALFYQVPGYYGWDPSKLLFVSFSLFFAMILADAGYGLLLGAALLFSWKKLARTDKGKAYRLLGLSLTVSTILYGVLVGSYFGMSPPIGSILESINILDINDFDVMMKLSIIVGAIHLGIANISMAYVNRHKRSALAKLGWLCAIYGGLFYWLLGESENGQLFSYCLIAVGALAIVFFTSERPIVKASDHLFRLFDGIFSLKNALNAFGDVLSYMRLFALGLASASLAITFNGLASDAYYAISGGGLLIAILILLVGHALNLVLSLMSGVVHGLRLNYIEFYNWGQAEEGTAFQTFAETEVKK